MLIGISLLICLLIGMSLLIGVIPSLCILGVVSVCYLESEMS